MNTEIIVNSPHYANLVKFIEGVNAKIAAYWQSSGFTHNTPSVVMVESVGNRYARLASFEQSPHLTGPRKATSVYCFYDYATGDLFKGSWKAPVKNGLRGNVNEPNVLDKFTQFGPAYLR